MKHNTDPRLKTIEVANLFGALSLFIYVFTSIFAYEKIAVRIVIATIAIISYGIVLTLNIFLKEDYKPSLGVFLLSLICLGVSFI